MEKKETHPNDLVTPIKDNYANIGGLTKREYFAGLAMQGILSRADCGHDYASKAAVHFADALIAQLNKEGGE